MTITFHHDTQRGMGHKQQRWYAAVAAAGLEDQLLGKLILKEKHELEEQRQQLLEEVQSYKKKIKQLEDDLLFRSVCVSGNLYKQSCRVRSNLLPRLKRKYSVHNTHSKP
jgi:predicted nuclease with TOPRIM domain